MGIFDSLVNDALDFLDTFKDAGSAEQEFDDFKATLQKKIKEVVQDRDPQKLKKFFKETFKQVQNAAQQRFPVIWEEWLQDGLLKIEDLAEQLYELADELSDAPFDTLIETLLQKQQDLKNLFQQAAIFCLRDPTEIKKRFTQLWGPLLATTLNVLGPDNLSKALAAVLTSDEGGLGTKISLMDLNLVEENSITAALRKLLSSRAYQFPAGVALAGLGLQSLLKYTIFPEEMTPLTAANEATEDLFAPLKAAIEKLEFKQPIIVEAKTITKVFVNLIDDAKKNEDAEWALLKMARFTPVGIFLIIAATIQSLFDCLLPWWKLLFNEIEKDTKLSVKRLPAPIEGGPKYIIFSDIHRDSRSDMREPMEFGSIDHFAANQELYCELLDFAYENGYTVLEAGDCDELWYTRDFSKRPREMLQEIIDTHRPVYDRLLKLHRNGRYIRLFGNHDCYIRNPNVFEVLQSFFDKDKKPDDPLFKVYDFAIIEGVKTMDESEIYFALDSYPYDKKAPMIVAHGHQWDFFNCDENNILGKLIVSAIATPVDFLDDPFIDMGGIAYSGSPTINFTEILANAFILKNFPAYLPARKCAHKIQHQDDLERHTIDDMFYLETLAALSGATIGVREKPDSEKVTRNNLICLGHTHRPQSQPYYDLKRLLPFFRSDFEKVEQKIADTTNGIILPKLNLIKSRYFNSGNTGWMEGIVWAIHIDETAQARSVYWTRDTRPEKPQAMDWELPVMESDLRKKIDAKEPQILKTIEHLSTYIDPVVDSLLHSIVRSIAAPFEALLSSVSDFIKQDVTFDSPKSLSDPLACVFISLLAADSPKTHTIQIPLPAFMSNAILKMKKFLEEFAEVPAEESTRFASAWLLSSETFPFLFAKNKKDGERNAKKWNSNKFEKAVLGFALQFPGMKHQGLPIHSTVELLDGDLIIRITVKPMSGRPAPRGIVENREIHIKERKFFHRVRRVWLRLLRYARLK
jgi:hypothetical protein